ncbi:MAG: peptidoglycan editing factor PgeF [Acutalibacteraceae bacterium]
MIFKSKNTDLNFVDGVGFLTFPSLSELDFVNHAFSTRTGGVSTGEFKSMNLNFKRGDDPEKVTENYKIFCKAAGFDYNTLVSSSQDHNTFVRSVTKKDCGIGIYREHDIQSVDALITNEPDVTLVTHYADCTPLFFADPVKRVIALAHAGWRGTVAKIGEITVDKMVEEYGSDPTDIIAVIGPAIGFCCYEVDTPVFEQFASFTELKPAYFTKTLGHGKYLIDLKEANRRMLLEAGLLSINITISDVCTKCNSGLFYSHRASGGKRGGLVAMMSIKES